MKLLLKAIVFGILMAVLGLYCAITEDMIEEHMDVSSFDRWLVYVTGNSTNLIEQAIFRVMDLLSLEEARRNYSFLIICFFWAAIGYGIVMLFRVARRRWLSTNPPKSVGG